MYKFLFIFLITPLFIGCSSYNDNKSQIPSIVGDIVDNEAWYSDESRVVTDVNITIPVPNTSLCTPYNNTSAPLRPCTFDDVNHDIDPYDDYEPTLAVKFFTSDFPLVNEKTNAILKQKGKSTRQAKQKSYKVKMNSKTNLWRDDRRLQFNKQVYDLTRVRNKLSFDLFEDIPNFPSLKTEFVHLGIDGVNYGLFTKVESYDKEYLLHRGWNKDDNLYKAQNFVFYLSDALKLDSNGHPVNLTAFERKLGINNGKVHTKLIEMLTAVNDYTIPIDTIIAKYFNRKNYITWFAINILTGNLDTINQNFFLLNPIHSDTFYFLPWDYDGAWDWEHQNNGADIYARWQRGLARWWDSPLHRRFISVKKNRDAIDAMVQHLKKSYFTKERIDKSVKEYEKLIALYVLDVPDILHLPHGDSNLTVKQIWRAECNRLSSIVDDNIKAYEEMQTMPMPFWQTAHYDVNSSLLSLGWDKSVDFNADATIVYDIKISDTPDFNTTVVSLHDYNDTKYTKTIDLAPKHYYMKVIAKEKNNPSHYQIAFDEYGNYHGVLEFEVKE